MRFSRRRLFLGAAAAAGPRVAGAPSDSQAAVGRRFSGPALSEIAFPLGGIGTGTVSLGGLGNLRDWEIFNRPGKNALLPFTFAALRIPGQARVLEREVLPPYRGSHGLGRDRAAGLPRFLEAVFFGSYPFANLFLEDAQFPVEVSLEAFNPMVPLDTAASSLPIAVLTYGLRSRAASRLDATLAFSITNPVGYDGRWRIENRRAPFFGQNVNEFRQQGGAAGLLLYSHKYPPDSFRYGSVALLTAAGDLSYRLRWEHGAWWDELPVWWREFVEAGRFPNTPCPPSDDGFTEYATLASHFSLQPGESKSVTFLLAWHFPNIEDYWTGQKPYFFEQKVDPKRLLRNHYGEIWKSAWEPALYGWENLASLRDRTRRYRDLLYSSTVPPEVIDAVSSQTSTLRTNTVLVLSGKVPLAFEGCGDTEGCCPFNCTHVYNYEQALAHLYPDLERRMRDIDFLTNLRDDGYMSFRTATPVQQGAYTRRPAADGQVGSILKLYREWQLSGDDAWLRELWPAARKALEFAWKEWDPERQGILEGEQHNTYDVRFTGPNSMTGTLYLGALLAASRMARHLGEESAAKQYEEIFRAGSARLDKLLWNGEYWQYGHGCLSDQLIGQWFAEVVHLGKLLPPEHIRTALAAIYRHNYRPKLREVASGQRIYALNEEPGLVICTWPRGHRPAAPFSYCDEVWSGVEYQVAAHLIYEGMVKEGVRLVRTVRDRHDGVRRNPWDEVECGHHYARALSSWSLLLACSGFSYSAPEKTLRFTPRTSPDNFRCLWVAGSAWGSYSQRRQGEKLEVTIRVEEGALKLASLQVDEAALPVVPPLRLRPGEEWKVSLGHGRDRSPAGG
jgi:uncharacterized protein (DUF608 family)